ncbi:Pentatricopeptide repeat-containing protein [Sesamum angolense]|uniref:Pentatricopeptide repeat-containing protein n=1 Tax=Sesamum angolense TaxID=2727404 RepID=A0AAE2BS27_9LAMI|nr:Pentatricopeptide repeat-containing protein [Sesamum angolense]
MIEEMPMGGDVFVWGGLLGGCKIHGNLEVAEEAAKQVMEVKPEDGGVYSLLAHMYANSQRGGSGENEEIERFQMGD